MLKYVCMYVWMYVRMYVCMYVYIYVYVCTWKFASGEVSHLTHRPKCPVMVEAKTIKFVVVVRAWHACKL